MYPPPPLPPPPPPPPRTHSRIILILKLLIIVFLFAALVVLVTDTGTVELAYNTGFISIRIHFMDMYTYRYLLGVCVTGMVYTLLQIVFSFYNIRTGNRLSPTFDFYGDKVLSYMLATGAAAGFGATSDMQSAFQGAISNNFFKRGYAASALVFIGFIYAAFLSIFSSYALPPKNV
ncbi:hypothetical protein SLEP1_g5731 [Rubroshorea leprosula]|uniref:CASP-like protein n=1 Tax=Rubroshorea leprosula TaxID=152421 RepID=A0AAV5I2Q5_9ROSI|nr:hypothetical protein SLEP1_g5731 [Rubroshorea leprosula]